MVCVSGARGLDSTQQMESSVDDAQEITYFISPLLLLHSICDRGGIMFALTADCRGGHRFRSAAYLAKPSPANTINTSNAHLRQAGKACRYRGLPEPLSSSLVRELLTDVRRSLGRKRAWPFGVRIRYYPQLAQRLEVGVQKPVDEPRHVVYKYRTHDPQRKRYARVST